MKQPLITYEIAYAAGTDTGNRNMRAAGRTAWNEDDWNAACTTFARLMGAGNCTE